MDKSSFCNMPFNSLEISPDGTCQVCCKINKPILNNDQKPYNLTEHSLNEIWNSDDLKKLRQQFLNGEKPTECELCWIEEKSQNISLRQHSFRVPKNENDDVEYLVLKLSNLCNLKCRICGPELSTPWLTESIKQNWISEDQQQKLAKNRAPKLGLENTEIIKNWVLNLKRLLAYGGEPFLSDELIKVLNICIDLKVANNISFVANTNGTIYGKRLIEILKHFKDVQLLFSIDDIESRFEFQRKNAKWSDVEMNLQEFHKLESPITVGLFPTVGLLNVFNLKAYLEWTLKFPKFKVLLENTLHNPKHLSLRNSPQALKQRMIESLNQIEINKYNVENANCLEVIKNFINLEPDLEAESEHSRAQNIHHFLKSVDQARNENYATVILELAQLSEI